MKKTAFCLTAIAVFASSPVFGQKVHIEYAHDFDFDSITTFQYVDTPESNIDDNPILAGEVVKMIKNELVDGGLTETQAEPDIFVTYHVTSEKRRTINTNASAYGGYSGYWGGWRGFGDHRHAGSGTHTGISHSHQIDYEAGTLIIDAFDSKEKKMIWRGSGTVTLKYHWEKQAKQAQKILTKLGKRWDKILHGNVK
jgi:hypothetical protein